MLKNYFITNWRNVLDRKNLFSLNFAGLSLGMWSIILVILYANDKASYDSLPKSENKAYHIDKEYIQEVATTDLAKS